jgi:predicted RNA-binding protein YlxR (DUF448 family)
VGRSTDADTLASVPRRRCVACRSSVPASELLRIGWSVEVAGPAFGRTLPGRGAWVHPVSGCLQALCPADLARAFRRAVTSTQVVGLVAHLVSPLVGRAESGPAASPLESTASRRSGDG